MKNFKQYLPETFLAELDTGPHDSGSPVSGDRERTDLPKTANEISSKLKIGDTVIIVGKGIQYEGKTGDVGGFSRDHHFIIVNLYNYGKYSFHESNVKYNDYADEEENDYNEERDEDDRALYSLRKLSGY